MATIANLAIGLTVNSARFSKGMTRAGMSVRSFAGGVTRAAAKVAALGTALAAAATGGGLTLLVKRQLEVIDSTVKTAAKLGLTTDALIGLQHAAELSGVNVRTFDMGLQRMTRRLAEAAVGTGEAKGALTELFGPDGFQGLSLLSPDKQFAALADAMENVASQSDRVRLGFKLFDSEGVALINTLRGGSAALKLAQADAARLGLTIGGVGGQQVVAFNDAMVRAKAAVTGLGRQLAVQLTPILEASAVKFTAWATSGETAGEKVAAGLKTTVKVVDFLGRTLDKLVLAWKFVALGAVGAAKVSTEATLAMQRALRGTLGLVGIEIDLVNKSIGNMALESIKLGGTMDRLTRDIDGLVDSLTETDRVDKFFESINQGAAAAAKAALEANKGKGFGLLDFAALERQRKALERFANTTIANTRTALEKYESSVGQLNDVLDAGLISWETYARAIRKARGELEGFKNANVPATAALERGTAAAFHAERQQFDPNKGDSIAAVLEQLEVAKETRDIEKRQLEILELQIPSLVVSLP